MIAVYLFFYSWRRSTLTVLSYHVIFLCKGKLWETSSEVPQAGDFLSLSFSPSTYSSILCVSWVRGSQDRVYGKEDSMCPSVATESLWIGQRLLMNVVFLLRWYCPTAKPLCLKLSSGKPKPLRPRDKYRTFTVILRVSVCVSQLLQYLLQGQMSSKSLGSILRTNKLG